MLGFRKNKSSSNTDKPEKTGLFARLREGLSRTRHSLTEGVVDLVLGSKTIDADLLEEIDKQLDKLKRQSRAAERYKELKTEERQYKAEQLALRWRRPRATRLAPPWLGMVTGAVETLLRKPRVGDFESLRHDVTHWKGWWKNRVSRILLVFLFSTLGSAAGTYIAGFRIFDKLF